MLNNQKTIEIIPERSCNGCTACCEGWLEGEAYGQKFYRGRPCHFKTENGCDIYESRPQHPCINFRCLWLDNKDIPYWLKPSLSKVIIMNSVTKSNIPYLRAQEMGQTMDAKVLSWFLQYAFYNRLNVFYTVEQGHNFIGSEEFIKDLQDNANP